MRKRTFSFLLLLAALLTGCAGYREPWMFWMKDDSIRHSKDRDRNGLVPGRNQPNLGAVPARERAREIRPRGSALPQFNPPTPLPSPKHSEAEVVQHYARAYRLMRAARNLVDQAKSWQNEDPKDFGRLRELATSLGDECKIWLDMRHPSQYLGSNREALAARFRQGRGLPPEFLIIYSAQKEIVSGLRGSGECLLALSAGAPNEIHERWGYADHNLSLCEASVMTGLSGLKRVNPQVSSQLTLDETKALFSSQEPPGPMR